MDIRSLSAILIDLSHIVKTLADQSVSPIPFNQELLMSERALQSGDESQMFRAMEILLLAAHASGLTKNATLEHITVYVETVQVLQMGGKQLPPDLL